MKTVPLSASVYSRELTEKEISECAKEFAIIFRSVKRAYKFCLEEWKSLNEILNDNDSATIKLIMEEPYNNARCNFRRILQFYKDFNAFREASKFLNETLPDDITKIIKRMIIG